MCVMWMPANLLSSGIVASLDAENTKINTEEKTLEEQSEKK